MNKKIVSKLITSIISGLLLILLGNFKISYIVGSYHAFFTPSSVLSPLIGIFGGLGIGLASVLARAIFVFIFSGKLSLMFLIYHTPSFCAAAYWRLRIRWVKFFIPIICMTLFWIHPVGRSAFPYAFYWFIPLFITVMGYNNIFMQAFAASFIAHAVGSVLWLYTVPMHAALWISLIPLVIIERLMFTGILVAGIYFIEFLSSKSTNFSFWLGRSYMYMILWGKTKKYAKHEIG